LINLRTSNKKSMFSRKHNQASYVLSYELGKPRIRKRRGREWLRSWMGG